jgi:1-deoxy-D-xylulose-5-phosphate reductoisomerase
MKIPIAYALSFPQRLPSNGPALDLASSRPLEFFEPDHKRFPCLQLACDAAEKGGTMPAVLNGANECAVEAFLDGRIGFTDISRVIETVLMHHDMRPELTIDAILAADQWAREETEKIIKE